MLKAVIAATFRILMFRAGPQDFPYSEQPRLTYACVALAILASGLLFGATAPPLAAFAAGVFSSLALALFTRMLLRLRQIDNRFAQTLGALFCCGSVLMLLIRLPMASIVPQMNAFLEQVQQHPELADDAANWPTLPPAASMGLDFLMLWLFAVTAHIYRQATDCGFLMSGALAALAILNVMLFLLFTTPLLALMAS